MKTLSLLVVVLLASGVLFSFKGKPKHDDLGI